MAKNRKNQSAAIRFGPAIKAVLLCALIGGAGVGYVWQKNVISDLGRQRAKREITLRQLQEQNKKLRDQLALLQRPGMLDQRVRELNLGLRPPEPSQIWRVSEPEARVETNGDIPRQYAAQQDQELTIR